MKTGIAVIVRSHLAGVFFGYLANKPTSFRCELKKARRIYNWKGSLSVDTIASQGIDVSGSRVCEARDQIIFGQIVQVIPCTEAARLNLESQPIAK